MKKKNGAILRQFGERVTGAGAETTRPPLAAAEGHARARLFLGQLNQNE